MANKQSKTQAEPEVIEIEEVAANTPAATAPKEKVVKQNPCQCGCGGITQSRFVMGHDARHKSNLVNLVLNAEASAEDRAAAERELADRGWTKFLDKTREVRSKPKKRSTGQHTRTHKREVPEGVSPVDYDAAVALLKERNITHGNLTAGEVEEILDGSYFEGLDSDEADVEDEELAAV